VRSVSRGESIAAAVGSSLVKRAKTVAARSGSKRDRSVMGLASGQKEIAVSIKKLGERGRNQLAKAGEADRTIPTSMPKHLFSGKRGFSANHR
jgi:nucleolar GTP-binding protein